MDASDCSRALCLCFFDGTDSTTRTPEEPSSVASVSALCTTFSTCLGAWPSGEEITSALCLPLSCFKKRLSREFLLDDGGTSEESFSLLRFFLGGDVGWEESGSLDEDAIGGAEGGPPGSFLRESSRRRLPFRVTSALEASAGVDLRGGELHAGAVHYVRFRLLLAYHPTHLMLAAWSEQGGG